MKPKFQSDRAKFPRTDYFFYSGTNRWRNYWSNNDDDRWEFRTGYNLRREYLIESTRERAKEMAVFAVVVIASAWPVIYMIVSVIEILRKGRPLDP